jgi:hypothetical protein
MSVLSALLILSCQPGPLFWKWSRTSRSSDKETNSFALGIDGLFADGADGFAVGALNIASAACRGSILRGRSSLIYPSILSCRDSAIRP